MNQGQSATITISASRKAGAAATPLKRLVMRFWFCFALICCMPTKAWSEDIPFGKKISAHVAANRIAYPAELRPLHTPVEIVVTFSLDREGKLLDSKVAKGSGSEKVDQDVLKWLSGLQPFPAIPPEIDAPEQFTLPIQFAASPAPTPTFDTSPSHLAGEKKLKEIIGSVCRGC